jgi:hypothetical protein
MYSMFQLSTFIFILHNLEDISLLFTFSQSTGTLLPYKDTREEVYNHNFQGFVVLTFPIQKTQMTYWVL